MSSSIELARFSSSISDMRDQREGLASSNFGNFFNGKISNLDKNIRNVEIQQAVAQARIGDKADGVYGRNPASNYGFQNRARPEFNGADFARHVADFVVNRTPYESFFKKAFAAMAPQQALAPAPVPVEDNPSNASTKMKDGKAVYESDTYTITASEGESDVSIFNKKTKETYRAFGDPHMDVDGKRAFDFYGKTSLQLSDGTKVTIDTVDADHQTTYSSKLSITNGGYGVQILGVDEKTKGDMAMKEFRGQGRALDRKVNDGVVLFENEDMTINDGRGFVATDKNGVQKKVDQDYINSVDLKKTLGQSSENVNKFDEIEAECAMPERLIGRNNNANECGSGDKCNSPVQDSLSASQYQPSRSASSDRFEALSSLMNMLKSLLNDTYKPAEQPKKVIESEKTVTDAPQRRNNPVKVNVKVVDLPNDLNVDVAMNWPSATMADVRVQVWG